MQQLLRPLDQQYTINDVEIINPKKGEYLDKFHMNYFQGYLYNRKIFSKLPREDLSKYEQIQFEKDNYSAFSTSLQYHKMWQLLGVNHPHIKYNALLLPKFGKSQWDSYSLTLYSDWKGMTRNGDWYKRLYHGVNNRYDMLYPLNRQHIYTNKTLKEQTLDLKQREQKVKNTMLEDMGVDYSIFVNQQNNFKIYFQNQN